MATATERFHVGSPTDKGFRFVLDLTTNEVFLVYPALYRHQVSTGHEMGAWYWRPADYTGGKPQSVPHDSWEEAVEGLITSQEAKHG